MTARLIAAILLLLLALPVLAGDKHPAPPASYCVTAGGQVRGLAEKSPRAWRGLSRAAYQSPAIVQERDADHAGPGSK